MKIYEDLICLLEEFINELDDETIKSFYEKRRQNSIDADNKLSKVMRDPEATKEEEDAAREEEDAAREEQVKADNKFSKAVRLVGQRNKRLEKKLADFKEKLLNRKPQKASVTQQAGSEHDDAILNQHYRNKLEKAFSNECCESLISLIEGEVINFLQKKKEKVLDKNAKKMADMMDNDELHAVRVLPNNKLMGDPAVIKKIKDIQAENEKVIKDARKA